MKKFLVTGIILSISLCLYSSAFGLKIGTRLPGNWQLGQFLDNFPRVQQLVDNRELRQVQDAIAQQCADWQAEETGVSSLSDVEKQSICGVIIKSPPKYTGQQQSFFSNYSIDFRNLTSIIIRKYNQGSCGSCPYMASAFASEIFKLLNIGIYTEYSREEMVTCCPLILDSGNGCCGNDMNKVYNYLEQKGILQENDYIPYDITASCESGVPRCMLTYKQARTRFTLERLGDYPSFSKIMEHLNNRHP